MQLSSVGLLGIYFIESNAFSGMRKEIIFLVYHVFEVPAGSH